MKKITKYLGLLLASMVVSAQAARVAYIYGDVSSNGTIPSGSAAPFHQMLLTDTGNRGCSEFKAMIQAEGHSISQHYDRGITLNSTFLNQFDVVIFGLHQKIWSGSEKSALDQWINAGGGILMYSDSAAGGLYSVVGIPNPTGQRAVNNVLSQYGMQVTVDQSGGTRSYTSPQNATNPIVSDQPVFEGEGVSPVAVDRNAGVEVLIPFDDAHRVSGGWLGIDTRNVTINNPIWASMALKKVGSGRIIAMFDRQPVWNNGEGSSIRRKDNKTILRRVVNYLAEGSSQPPVGNDSIDLNALPSTIVSSKTLQIDVPYTASTARDVVVEFWDSGWINQGTTTVDAGTGTAKVTITLNQAPAAGSYILKASIRPVGTNWKSNIKAGSSPVTVTSGGTQPPVYVDSIDFDALPSSLVTSDTLLVDVPYTAAQSRDIVIELWNSKWMSQGTTTVDAGAGVATVTVKLSQAPAAGSYTLKASIRPVGSDWRSNIKAASLALALTSGGSTPGTEAPVGMVVTFTAKANGKLVCSDRALDATHWNLAANRTAVGTWEQFTVEDAGNGFIALKAKGNGKYVTADLALDVINGPLAANSLTKGDAQAFTWIKNADETVTLKAKVNSKFVSSDASMSSNLPLVANATQVGESEKFTVTVK